MSSTEKRAIEKCRDLLVRKVQISPGFLRYFIQYDLLDEAIKEKILNIQTPTQQTEYFLHTLSRRPYSVPVLIQKLKIERRTIHLANILEHAYEQARNEQKFKAHEKDRRVMIKLFEELNNFYLLVYGTKPWNPEKQTLDFHLKKCRMAVNAMKKNKELLEEKYGQADSFQTLTKKLAEERIEHEKWYRQLLTTEQEIIDLRAEYRRHNHLLQDKVRKREDEISKLKNENEKITSHVKLLAKYTYKSELLVNVDEL